MSDGTDLFGSHIGGKGDRHRSINKKFKDNFLTIKWPDKPSGRLVKVGKDGKRTYKY